MKTAISPKLVLEGDTLFNCRGKYFWWFGIDVFKKCIEFPKAKAYWMEIADRQWPDKSGVPIQVGVESDGWAVLVKWRHIGGRYRYDLCCTAHDTVIKFISPKTTATIYFRLLYEE